ncbi:Y4yA family PLP-dependent enzyme [Roseiconus nitratireducens]|uniref:Y4yA family PLP-dependent enzyme n=1 Tax=Roseiconus nitratireducens TaxID=2605748 RepID=A0A5M6D208_9BACT|nr:Y4yA family PLP-dependent enzyme [Roseiconus nitratireducens]KAA5539165.1 Y4yA family PLP-dependent enzyme [Roseiconus nitratireducens]
MKSALADLDLTATFDEYGSPVNLISPDAMNPNVEELRAIARTREVDLQIFFARKANKCLAFVDAANRLGIGVDTASEIEVQQTLDRGTPATHCICTAAVKSKSLVGRCVDESICLAIDNHDELERVRSVAAEMGKQAIVALRLSGFKHADQTLYSRFGFDCERDVAVIQALDPSWAHVAGIHFHLDGYDPHQRVSAIDSSLDWIEKLRQAGHLPAFIDMGGGLPVCYLESENQWTEFWKAHAESLLHHRGEITFQRHKLGRQVVDGRVVGSPASYPYFQSQTRSSWLATVLDAPIGGSTVAQRLNRERLQLRCEPGRSLLDGCGMTIARVEYRKRDTQGRWLIGLSMNRTQCRTTSDDFLVDPILVPASAEQFESIEGYLVGAYCMESELLSWRRFRFPCGVRVGDAVVFPNTAGYLMHFLESRSHQFPLASNLVMPTDPADCLRRDDIDQAIVI